MKVLILDRKPSTKRLEIEELIDMVNQRGMNTEVVDVDSRDGTNIVELYSAMSYPAILVVRDDGQLVRMWQHNLPTIADLEQNYGRDTQ